MPGQGALVGLTAKLGLDTDDREVERETSGLKDKIESAIDESEGAPSAETSGLVDDIMEGIEEGAEGATTGMFDQDEFEQIQEQFTALGQDMPDTIGRPSMGPQAGGDGGEGGSGPLDSVMAAGGKFLKVGLAGAVGFGILSKVSKMADASPRMTKTLGMLARAVRLFARPFYDWIAKTMEGGIMDLLSVASEFNKDYQKHGLKVAVQNLGEDVFGGGPPELPEIDMPGFDIPSPDEITGVIDDLEWDDFLTVIDWANFVMGITLAEWVVDLVWDQWISSFTWDNFIAVLEWLNWLTPIDWGGLVDYFDDWGQYLIPLAWDGFLDKLSWSAWVDFILWSDWIPGVDWSDWLNPLDWDIPGANTVLSTMNSNINPLNWDTPTVGNIMSGIKSHIDDLGWNVPSTPKVVSIVSSKVNPLNWNIPSTQAMLDAAKGEFEGSGRGGGGGGSGGLLNRAHDAMRKGKDWLRLQHGGLVTSPTEAVVGDGGPEVVAPFSEFMETLDRERERGSGSGGDTPQPRTAGGSGGGAREVVEAIEDLRDELKRLDPGGDVYLDDKKVGEARRENEQRYRRSRRVTK